MGSDALLLDSASRLELQRLSSEGGRKKQRLHDQSDVSSAQHGEDESPSAMARNGSISGKDSQGIDLVVGVAWGPTRGVLAVLWDNGTLAIAENPTITGAWSVVSWFHIRKPEEEEGREEASETAPRHRAGAFIPPEAHVTVRWSNHALLVAWGRSLQVFAFYDWHERAKKLQAGQIGRAHV